jgi:hypothetical protein
MDYKSSFKTKILKTLKESFNSNNYYFFLGKINGWIETPPVYIDTFEEDITTMEEILSLHKITANDVFYSVLNQPWSVNTVYDTFSSSENLTDKMYYVVVENISWFDIFICIDNNSNSPSLVAPIRSDTNSNEYIITSDGYVWKHVYRTTTNEYNLSKQLTNYIVISDEPDSRIRTNTTFGSIEKINIIESGEAFPFAVNKDGDTNYKISSSTPASLQLIIPLNSSFTDISRTNNFYNNDYSLLIYNSNGVEEIFTIDTFTNNGDGTATIITCESFGIPYTDKMFKILPRVKIIGSGSGALAYPVLKSDNTIEKIEIISGGQNYFYSTVDIIGNYNLEIVYSPTGGIGFDPLYDLKCNSIIVYKELQPSGSDLYNKNEALSATTSSKGFFYFVSSTEYVIPNYVNSSIRQFGIICREPRTGSKDNDFVLISPDDELKNYDVFTLCKTNPASPAYFTDGITEFTTNSFICQTDSTGQLSAWGEVLSIAFKKPTVDPPEQTVKFPKIAVKTFFGTFNTTDPIKLFDINNRQSTTLTDIYIYSTSFGNVKSDGRGRLLDIQNVEYFELNTDSPSRFIITINL